MREGTGWNQLLALEVSAFGFFGLFWGCFAVLLADLSGALGLSPGPLGVALLVGAGASIAAMGALGWTSDRLGRRAYLIGAAVAFGAGIVGLALGVVGPRHLLALLASARTEGGHRDPLRRIVRACLVTAMGRTPHE
jgi:MFS family permease